MAISRRLIAALDFLGTDYCMRVIDGCECVYRDLGNGYDIEVCGFYCRRRNNIDIHVWQTEGAIRIVESVFGIASLPELKSKLDCLVAIYGRAEDGPIHQV
ncbi:hypothetical protein [Anaeroselena agilis]|uniref:Uncharacterized protein n=1 Tax=Anaeroselena agilis TaxID=3063788 RepID=A0ABU3P3J6_9FIRM|nr:hypothetical protein [Selenomonadales bacterium 4137-cl]